MACKVIYKGQTFDKKQIEDYLTDLKSLRNAAEYDLAPSQAKVFNSNIEQGLREAAQQLNSSEGEAQTAREFYGDVISDMALKYFPNEKSGAQDRSEMLSQPEQAQAEETEIPQEDEITVGEMLDRKGNYKGQRGTFIQEGQTIEFRTDDGKRIYELGNVDEIIGSSITDFDIAQEETVIKVNEDGTIEARGKNYTVSDAENPLKAIQRDKEGNLTGVKLVDENGNDRTFRGQYAEDLAYQLTLQDINRNNESKTTFQTFLNEDAATSQELEDGGLSETANEKANEDTGSVSGVEEGERPQRTKIDKNERKPAKKAGKSIPENKGTAKESGTEKGVPQSTDATGRRGAETATSLFDRLGDRTKLKGTQKATLEEQFGKNLPDFAIFINKNFDKIVNQLIDSKNITRKCQ